MPVHRLLADLPHQWRLDDFKERYNFTFDHMFTGLIVGITPGSYEVHAVFAPHAQFIHDQDYHQALPGDFVNTTSPSVTITAGTTTEVSMKCLREIEE